MPKKQINSLIDIHKLVSEASPAIELARTLASIEAPAKTLRDLGKTLTVNNDLMKSIESASDIARRLTQHSDLAARLTQDMPKIALSLPEISTSIKASLPEQLPDFSALPPAPSPIAMSKGNPEAVAQANVQLDSIADLGRMVRRLRERRKQSQQEFSDLAGVGRRFVSELENGKPTLEFAKVLQVARAAGISLIARDRSR